MSTLFVVVPGFGLPNLDMKIDILSRNISKLQECFENIRLEIFFYSDRMYTLELVNMLNNYNIEYVVNYSPGVIGQFLFGNKKNLMTVSKTFDYTLVILDDVEIMGSIRDVVRNYVTSHADILSFPLSNDSVFSHAFSLKTLLESKMLHVNFLELFAYFMSANVFERYLRVLLPNSAWLWGLDFVLHNVSFRLIRMESVELKHYFKGNSYHKHLPDPHYEYNIYTSIFTPIKKIEILDEIH
jgi:hypothetical protein